MAAPHSVEWLVVARSVTLTALWVVLALSLATVLLFGEPVVGVLAELVHGGSPDEAVLLQSAEQIRRYTVGAESTVLVDPAGLVGLDWAALDHLLDVRAIVRLAGLVLSITMPLAAITVLAAAVGALNVTTVASSLRWAGLGVGAAVVVIGAVVALGFDWFFVTFHHVLFAEGTWTFSSESLLMRTFPEPFWIAAAAGWLGVVIVLATTMLGVGTALRPRAAQPPSDGDLAV